MGGEGHPTGLEAGYFVKPTVFVNVRNDMTIAREEIFSPGYAVPPGFAATRPERSTLTFSAPHKFVAI